MPGADWVLMLCFSRSERIHELLGSKSVKLIHKFSIVFPAHVVATVLCSWFLISFLIVGLLSQDSSDKLVAMGDRVKLLEDFIHLDASISP